ncbi:EXS family-domain-containing protein [Naematelia encephala]|uniref:EXS family-domain-containing protein n=1 Tax=Naematelia encephala TaxID=71784 RepID=A0A1Y2BFM7_9TREE|nr:EXS family-domain-containing protein [Naematelia encephala]
MLFELNLDAYVQARINYEVRNNVAFADDQFVMELSRPTLDYRSYLELPAFLFMTLSYCFFFSFYRVGASNVAPTTWPAAWLVFFLAFWLNPLPIFRRQARYWFLRVLFRVCTPGYSRVEFIAFFLADELNSLVYTMQNFYFIGCAYGHHWPGNVFTVCPSGKQWPYGLLLCLPALSRLIQCLKRWYDSRLGIHLINAGKYLSVILQQCLFVLWRSRGSEFHDASFIVWVIIATISATYTCSWDLVVDWSLFRPNAGLLRQDLGYGNHLVYYIAIVTNILIRFVFIWYIPASARHTRLRSFFFALAEMLRRWQWNFFRVETEHLGNADAYRVTREIPLPYRRVEHDIDDEDFGDSHQTPKKTNPLSVRLDRFRRGLVGESAGRGPGALNVGARGHAGQREYEARRPGDLRRRNTDAGGDNGEV